MSMCNLITYFNIIKCIYLCLLFASTCGAKGMMMINQKKYSSLLWLIPSLIALLLTGCTNSSVKSSQIKYPIINYSNLASSSTIKLSQKVKTKFFSISIPASWNVNEISNPSGSLYFNKKSDTDFSGGIYCQEYDVNKGESMPETDALLHWMLPNHSVIKNTTQISGLSTDTYLLQVEQSQPAATGDLRTTNWTYIIFFDRNKTTNTKFVAFELFLNTNIASEADAVKIASSFKLS